MPHVRYTSLVNSGRVTGTKSRPLPLFSYVFNGVVSVAKLTDKQRKKIIADYTQFENYSAVARLHGVSRNTVKSIVLADCKTAEKCRLKKEENTAAILAHMGRQKNRVCGILDKLLEALDDPDKMECATLPQIATALGILVDKYSMDETRTNGAASENNLFEAIQNAGEVDTDDLPEVE